jgi:hypothetical protein
MIKITLLLQYVHYSISKMIIGIAQRPLSAKLKKLKIKAGNGLTDPRRKN